MQTLVRDDGRNFDPEDLRPEACKHTVVWVVDMGSARVMRGACATCAAASANRAAIPPVACNADRGAMFAEATMELSHAPHR